MISLVYSESIAQGMMDYQNYTNSHYPSIEVTFSNHTEWIGCVFCLEISEDGNSIEDARDNKIYLENNDQGVLVTYYRDTDRVEGILDQVSSLSSVQWDHVYQAGEMTLVFHAGAP